MNNAEKFKQIFGLYATELWSMPEGDFLAWLNRAAETAQNVSDSDVISRKAAIEALARMMPRSYTPDGSHPADEEIFKAQEIYVDCIESIEILPAVQPEIIHCKDCKHWRDDHTCHEHSLVSPMCANEYCSRAERRTDERFDRQTGGD